MLTSLENVMGHRWISLAGRAASLLTAAAFAVTIMVMVLHARSQVRPRPNAIETLTALDATGEDADWPHYGRDAGGSRFSPLSQITPENAGRLELAWIAHTGTSPAGESNRGNFEATPLKIGEALYVCTGDNVVISLDAATGHIRWRFDPGISAKRLPPFRACRGVAYARITGGADFCAERIYTGTLDAALWALDATSGKPCTDFGEHGRVDLLRGMSPAEPGYYYVTSAPTVVRGKIVVGGWVSDNQYVGEPSGVVRAFDVRTGVLAWAWDVDHPERHGEPPAGETYSPGTPNSWAPMSADERLGLVFVPTGNATPDFVAMHRSPGSQTFGSSVVAIDAEMGVTRWSFQTVHHDIWDYDVASQPSLFDLRIGGRTLPALVQPTKTAQLFVFDRRDGSPLAPIEERPVPQKGGVPGEKISPTQPFAVGMPSLAGPRVTETQMWGITPFDQLWCRIRFRELRYEGAFTPSSVQGTLKFPGYAGGMNWGSASVDPDRQILVVNSNRFASVIQLLPRPLADEMGAKPAAVPGPLAAQQGTAYGALVAGFLSPLFMPCQQPPYGFLTAVDLRTRSVLWEAPLGTARDSGPLGHPLGVPIPLGPPSMGGSISTRGGVTFVAAAQERAIRAFDTRSGRELWVHRLPAGGQATPMTYLAGADRRQYVVVAAGGYKGWNRQGDSLVAFKLAQ